MESSLPLSLRLGLGLELGCVNLKDTKKTISFVDIDICNHLESLSTSTIEKTISFIDRLKLYKPIDEECKLLHISDDRLDMHQIINILLICGATLGTNINHSIFSNSIIIQVCDLHLMK